MPIILATSFPVLGFILLTWVLTGPVFHVWMIVAGVVLTAMGAFASIRWIVRNEVAVSHYSRPLNVHVWHHQWDAAQFLYHFQLFLRVRGWRIIDAKAEGTDRFRIIADKSKGKDRVALRGVRPGQAATQDDFAALDALRHEERVTRAALVVDEKPAPQDISRALSRNCLVLSFADLVFLEDALHVSE